MKVNNQAIILILILTILLVLSGCSSNATENQPEHKDHFDKVNTQGDIAMGFSHEKTNHQFILLKDGGAIQVKANNSDDTMSQQMIRKHLSQLLEMFSSGNFEDPMSTHGKIPPGVPPMKKLKTEIDYKYEIIENGGRVRIFTTNVEALKAIHNFLLFQIEDHQTGDSTVIKDYLD